MLPHNKRLLVLPSKPEWWKNSETLPQLITTAREGGVAKEIDVNNFLLWSKGVDLDPAKPIYFTDILWCIEKRRIDHEFLLLRLLERDKRSTWIRIERDTHSWLTALPLRTPGRPRGWNRKDTILMAADGRSLLKKNEPQYCHARIIFHSRHLKIQHLIRLLHSYREIGKNYNLFTFNCYWLARTIWWDLAKATGGDGLEFKRLGWGTIEGVLGKVEARTKVKPIDAPGDMEDAIRFTRYRLSQHVAKSVLGLLGVSAVLVSIVVMPRSAWQGVPATFDDAEDEVL